MSSRAHRWEQGKSPLSQYHGGSAAAARAAVMAARVARLQQVERAKGIAREQMAARVEGQEVAPSSQRLRPRARAADERASRWNCRASWQRKRKKQGANPAVWFPKDKAESEARRAVLMAAQGGLCALCGDTLSEAERESATRRPSVDHTIPRDMGGTNLFNLVCAHNQCNADKQNDLPTGCELIWLLIVNACIRQLSGAMQRAFYREPASVTGTGTAETRNVAQGEACQNGPQGDAQ